MHAHTTAVAPAVAPADQRAARAALVASARKVISLEASAIKALAPRVNGDFSAACEMMLACTGRVVLSGPKNQARRLLSMPTTCHPSSHSVLTHCEPINPPEPVTSAVFVMLVFPLESRWSRKPTRRGGRRPTASAPPGR